MIIKNIKFSEENLTIYYPTLYVSQITDNSVTIKQIINQGNQKIQNDNIVTVTLNVEDNFILNLIQIN